MTEIYPAGEKPLPGVTGQALAESVRKHGHHEAVYEPDLGRLAARVAEESQPGDIVLTLGAGNVWRVGEELLELLEHGPVD